jgi:hypothetical protein
MKGDFFSKILKGVNKTSVAFTRHEQLFMIVMGGFVGAVGGYETIVFRRLITMFLLEILAQ